MKIFMKTDAGLQKEVKVGFSWTTFFFGALVPLIRGDLKWFAIMLLLSIILGSFTFGIGSIVVGIVFSFKYNAIYTKGLIEKGYKASTEDGLATLKAKNIIA